jgi:hypothetical protein
MSAGPVAPPWMRIVRSALQHDYQAIKLKFAYGEATNFALVWELHHRPGAAARPGAGSGRRWC